MARPLLLKKDCNPKCKSAKHVDTIIAQIPRVSLQEFQAYSCLCYNWYHNFDLSGRSALHLAASCGATEILEWLLEKKKVDLSAKDVESSYTALHRAVYYGQLAAAKILIQYDSDLQECDNEGLTPLDLVVFDRPSYITYSINEPNEVSTWGENINSILGHPTTHKRTNPDVVSEFKKLGLSIKQMVLRKYHTVFLTQNGLVYSCGHGQGGRLGHGNQHTVLVPKLMHSISNQTCVEIAAGTDHTLLRMEGGVVYSCGLNSYHQLGHQPDTESSLFPKPIKCKSLRKKAVCGVCASRFHSVVWTSDEIYAVGLNAGQLGHPKGDKYVDEMLPVPTLKTVAAGLVTVTCSDAATACLTAKGDVIVLHEYMCRRIAVRLSAIEQIVVTGGTLDHHNGVDMLMAKGGHELVLALRSKWGQLYVWRGSNPTVKRCQWKRKRQLTVSDVTVNDANLLVTTAKGQAFIGKLSNKTKKEKSDLKEITKDNFKDGGDVDKQPRLLDRMLKEEVEEVVVTRLPGVHRGLKVASDVKGRNFAVIQALPNGCLSKFPSVSSSEMLENFGRLMTEADENDIVHDAVIQVENRTWPVHCYVIGMRSHHFHQVFQKSNAAATTTSSANISVFKVDDVLPDIMDQIVQFMYTDTCDFMTPGFKMKSESNLKKNEGKTKKRPNNQREMEEDVLDLDGKQTSAFVMHQSRKKNEKNRAGEKMNTKCKEGSSDHPLNRLMDAAQKLGVKNLTKRLNQVKCDQGIITVQQTDKSKLCFDRQKFPELYDLTIVTEDGKEIECHKCVLVSRLEYFYSMFATGWVESTTNPRLMLSAPGEALEILIDFLYTDSAPQLTDCTNEKLLCEVLVVSDQLLAWRLKELCEIALANIISFKNVGELLEFSEVYNADQLKESCQQFMCLNLSAVLEARILEVLSEELLHNLTKYYRATIPNVAYRVLTPSSQRVDQDYLDGLVAEYKTLAPQFIDPECAEPESARRSKQVKKRGKQRVKSVNEDDNDRSVVVGDAEQHGRIRHLSVSSDISIKSEDDIMTVVMEVNKQIEIDEKKFKLQASKLEKTTRLPSEKLLTTGPTQPEDVPLWIPKMKTLCWGASTNTTTDMNSVNNNNNNNHTPNIQIPTTPAIAMSSPTSPTSPVSPFMSESPSLLTTSPNSPPTNTASLRDIMKQEYQTSHSNINSQSSRKQSFPRHSSRKENKKHRNKKEDVEDSHTQTVPKAPACPWGSFSGVVSSFRDLMIQDKTPHNYAALPARGSNLASPPSGSSRSSNKNRKSTPITIPFKSPPANQTTSPSTENPWLRRSESATTGVAAISAAVPTPATFMSTSTSPRSAVNFSDIVQDEMEKEEILIKIKQKPLALIQLEEKAMQELLQFYKASERIEEYVTVERVSKNVAANPVWHRQKTAAARSF